MKIIFASKFYYRRGGLEAYLFKTKELLESHGHEVIPFSTDFHQNYDSEYSKYFCSYYNLSREGFSKREGLTNVQALKNMFFNREAYQNMKSLIHETKPDLLQGFGVTKHLSYSIFKAAKEMGVPTVMRLSDYAILCPNSSATDGDGNLCLDFACSKGDFSRAIRTKCVHDSVTASFIGKLEVKINLWLDVYKKYIDYFIAPSRFIRNIFIDNFGISPQRILYQPIFFDLSGTSFSSVDENYFLYAGRLSKEKGVYTLLKSFKRHENYRLVIAGTGPEEKKLKKFAHAENIKADFVGFKDFNSLQNLIRRCSAVVIPSEWYENSPNIVLEAYASGKPAIGSRIGGIPELIEDGKTGLLFEAGDVNDLTEKIELLHENKELKCEMGLNARNLIKERFTAEEHYENLVKIYGIVQKKKVLLVNNYYYNRGGDCTYMFGLKDILESKGHNVIIFSMHHPKNFESVWSKYFVNYINYDEEVKKISLKSGFKVATRTIFFLHAKKMIEKIIREERPDVAHFQNIHHHITPSILYSCRKYSVPVVWTLHDYQLICSNISFLAHGKICERCKKHKYYWPTLIRCKKGSLAASLMSSIEITLHNLMGIDKLVSRYIAPSEFLKNKFIEYGYNENKINHIDHFTNVDLNDENNNAEDYYVFVGRLSEEKGIKTLIDAASMVGSGRLLIVGEGPLRQELEQYANDRNKNMIIEFVGQKDREDVFRIISRSRFLVIPSEWYETSGLVILEAFASGKPVIGSMIGGIPELIEDRKTGLIFEMGNAEELSEKIAYLLHNPVEAAEMGRMAREFVVRNLSGDVHYKKILEIYNEVCARVH